MKEGPHKLFNYRKYLPELIIILFILNLFSNDAIAQREPANIRFGVYTTKINNSNRAELDASMTQWASGVQNNTKINWLGKSTFANTLYDSKLQLTNDIRDKKIDFIAMSTLDYFELGLSNLVTPFLTATRKLDNKFERYLLITNIKNAVTDISRISNAEIVFSDAYFLNLIKIWLKVELDEKAERKNIRTITLINSPKNEVEILHSVFFENLNFAVVREETFQIACELNAQLTRKIKILDVSPKVINIFFGYTGNVDPEIRAAIQYEGVNLHKSINGKQLLNLAKAECVHTINPQDLNETEDLIRRYKRKFKQ